MNDSKKNNSVQTAFFLVLLSIFSTPALADLGGGINTVNNYATTLKTGLITLGSIVAVIYLLWKGIECWRGRADWGEFGMAVLYVAIAGAAGTLAPWAWKLFQS